jgi:hypothetical protein
MVKCAGCSSGPNNFRATSCGGKYVVYSIPIDTIEVLRERVENVVTIRNQE